MNVPFVPNHKKKSAVVNHKKKSAVLGEIKITQIFCHNSRGRVYTNPSGTCL